MITTTSLTSSRRAVSTGALLVALLVVGLNFRAPITAVPPVLSDVAAGLGMSSVAAGLLTGLPILCFAALAPVASWLIGRVGPYRAMTIAVGGVLLGTLLRSALTGPAGVWTAVAGTAVIGASITIGNVAAPVIVSRDFTGRAPVATGLYTASMNLGSVFTTTLTVPLAAWLGWQAALAAWSVLAVVALVSWAWVVRGGSDGMRGDRRARSDRADGASDAGDRVLRRPITWVLSVAFVGQSFSYFAMTGVLPELLGDKIGFTPAEAGVAASLFQGLAILGSLVLPATHALRLPIGVASAVVSACWLSLPLGLLLAPGWWALWCSLAGLAQGGNFAVIFTLVAQRAGGPVAARRMAATIQSCGYVIAFTGPSTLFAVHDAVGGWDLPLTVVLVVLTGMGVALAIATRRPRTSPTTTR
ncbi:MFS transporter [Myceligenerans cantabricum]